ncbi:putative DNA repair helicase [Trypanosoma rangeli]|uniref:Putative DNA repair helicase n=1 Tax=Trypanosoma rangeli TaxID=5698 RepID=A0A3R7RLU2_TRYRA|nr:putative DNA repair helicase [Trypanosoma rangeli]RNF06681.1 putative DNA repair helicase [Trypanosoma rangeli]|eukprot:RNF06681.1 putative DNA repair helicase [Trypanosoma rangeli]
MYDAGPFRVPFPFDPYPLQLHAMEAIRGGLAAGDVVVLESPTGTGKTQVLLNGVLSHVFEPIVASGGNDAALLQQQNASPPKTVASVPPLAEAVGRGRKRQRKGKATDKQRTRVSAPKADEDVFLLEHNTDEAISERQRELAMMGGSSSLCSSSSSSSVAIADDDDEVSDDEWEPCLQALQKPKVYFSSRTHTQLQQLTEELGRTVFARHPVRPRRRQHIVIGGEHNNEAVEPVLDDTPHMLRYVHVAGRQQLCINASLRAAAGNNNERLNELCLEAMKYEYSKEGRAARKQQEMRGKFSSLADIEDNARWGKVPNGCGYCRRERLKILRDYVNIAPRGLLEMRELGRTVGACPFLATRELLRGADVVLIPYSYLVSPEVRHILLSGTATNAYETAAQLEEAKKHRDFDTTTTASHLHRTMPFDQDSILPPNFSGDVIVVDEAHNLVDACRNATASTVSSVDLSLVRRILDGYCSLYEKRLLTRNKQRLREMVSFVDNLLTYLNVTSVEQTNSAAAVVCTFSSFVFDANVDNVNVYSFLTFLSESRLLPKLHSLVAFLTLRGKESSEQERHSLAATGRSIHRGGANKAADNNTTRGGATDAILLAADQDPKLVTGALYRFDAFLRWYSRSDEHSRFLLRRAPVEGEKGPTDIVTLHLLQLEPGTHTLFPVLDQVQAAVLAGGTMKPLALTCDLLLRSLNPRQPSSAYADEMDDMTNLERKRGNVLTEKKVLFIEEGHIVPFSSIAVFTLGVGPSGYRVELQHATRNQWDRQFEEIAAALLNFCRVIPDGVIVFFTSYEMEEKFLRILQQTGLYDAINDVKRIFREPGRLTTSRVPAQRSEEGTSLSNAVDAMLAEYAQWIRTESSGGALLFAVMGGKLSEGINFNDDLGRAVIVIGLPYANPSDVELQLYLGHIVNTRLLRDSTSAGSNTPTLGVVKNEGSSPFNSSAEWGLFTDLCLRTVNQSMGRCIRHAADYAVVVLFDARYGERPDIHRRIASWMQPSVRVTRTFGECFRGVRDFFKALH